MKALLPLFILVSSMSAKAQIDTVIVSLESEFEQPGFSFTYSSVIDRNNGSFVYSAALNQGLIAYEIGTNNQLTPIDTLGVSFFDGESICNLIQEDSLLYVGMGDIQKAVPVKTGAAVVNISDPYNMSVVSYWDTTGLENGTAVLRKEGDFLYLGCMQDGMLIMNAADPNNLQALSVYLPDTVWPGIVNYLPNARGMDVRNDTVYLAFDAGGLRVIDATDKYNPIEVAHYVNPDMYTLPASPAYNNILVKGSLAYIAIDYCGLEVVDLSDLNNIQRVDWFNPWGCTNATGFGTPGSWFGGEVHSNELVLGNGDSLLYVSGGDNELWIFSLANPSQPTLVGEYAVSPDSVVAWGVDVFDGKIISSCVDNSGVIWPFNLAQPYYSNWGGIKLFTVEVSLGIDQNSSDLSAFVFPNPFSEQITVRCKGKCSATLFNLAGELMGNWTFRDEIVIDNASLPKGMYFHSIVSGKKRVTLKLVKN